MSPEFKNSTAYSYFLMIVLASLFGSSFVMIKFAIAEVPPITIAFLRTTVAMIVLGGVMVIYGQNFKLLLPHWKMISMAGLFGNAIPFTLIGWGQVRVDAGLTAILISVMPLITLVLAHFFANEKLNRYKLLGFFIGLIGVAYLFGFDKLVQLGDESVRQYAIIMAACCYAVHAILSKKLTGLPRKSTSCAVLMASFVFLLPFCFYIDRPWELTVSTQSWIMILLLGLLPTAIGTLMIFTIVEREGASFLSQINFFVPLFGVFWAVLILNETLPVEYGTALIIILAGIMVARYTPRKSKMEPTL